MIQRKFIPGEEWIYLKIYGGPKFLERILTEEIFDLLMGLLQNNIIDTFFYIRYADPQYHLRLRMHSSEHDHIFQAIDNLHMVLSDKVQNRGLYRICYDTYHREIERYGSNTMAIVENLFCLDSIQVLQFLRQTNRADDRRWLMSMHGIDQLLDIFGLSDDRKTAFYRTGYQNYAQEFGIHKSARIVMDKKYRERKPLMETLFNSDRNDPMRIPFMAISEFQRLNVTPVVSSILAMEAKGLLQVDLHALISSLIHMHINRMFRTQPRKYELLIYHFLSKLHRSRLARAARSVQNS